MNMTAVDTFTVRDLRERTGQFMQDAEAGKVNIVTKHGRPKIVAVPFDDRLMDLGLHKSMALRLFEEGTASLSKAAKIAGMSQEAFMGLLSFYDVDVVTYDPEELEDELQVTW